jgi:two-component system, chemotaxis family, response regulator Rcp1
MNRRTHVLLVEDNPADADLTRETLMASNPDVDVSIAKDGIEALDFLHGDGAWSKPGRPTLIVLDLNLPRKDGRQVLAVLKSHDLLRQIPVVVLSSSDSEQDISSCYQLGANCYIAKPDDLQSYRAVLGSLEDFWLAKVKLPRRDGHSVQSGIGYGM